MIVKLTDIVQLQLCRRNRNLISSVFNSDNHQSEELDLYQGQASDTNPTMDHFRIGYNPDPNSNYN